MLIAIAVFVAAPFRLATASAYGVGSGSYPLYKVSDYCVMCSRVRERVKDELV